MFHYINYDGLEVNAEN